MSITQTTHNRDSIWNFFETSSNGPTWDSVPIEQSSTSSQIICSFQFEGESVSFVLRGSFAPNPNSFLTLGALASQANVTVSEYQLSVAGSLIESASLSQGVPLSLMLAALPSTNRSALQQYYSGDDVFIGSNSNLAGGNANDSVNGYAGNDTFTGYSASGSGSNSDKFFGGDGIDTLVLQGKMEEYSITSMNNVWMPDNLEGIGRMITDSVTGRDGNKTERYVERLQFSDKKLALDLSPDGNAGQAMEFIGVIAPALLDSAPVRGLIISLFDQGNTMEGLCQLALDIGLAPKASNADLANAVFHNVTGSTANQDMTNVLVGYIEGHSQANFLATVAGMQINVDLVGLQQTGIEYAL